jgi:hypothetical protein
MRHVGLAIVAAAALMLAGSAASAGSKHHPRHARHARAPAIQYAPVWKPAPPIEGPRAFVPPGTCIQDEGYGRWTYCGQGTPGGR